MNMTMTICLDGSSYENKIDLAIANSNIDTSSHMAFCMYVGSQYEKVGWLALMAFQFWSTPIQYIHKVTLWSFQVKSTRGVHHTPLDFHEIFIQELHAKLGIIVKF